MNAMHARWVSLFVLLHLPLLADTAGEEFFEKRIRPILTEKCYACHGSKLKTPMGGLRLDTRAGTLAGGQTGPAVVPGSPEKSLLLEAISYSSLKLRMPPTGKLPDDQIADLRRWIELGAPDPRVETDLTPAPRKQTIDFASARKFWAFQPPADRPLPPVKNGAWVNSPIDRFVLARLEAKGERPAPAASRRDWIRRVSFDLTGLPPTPGEVNAFLEDGSYDKVVDRLLASPHYGERWARHWLDLVRFAETNGHEFDNPKIDAWRYRDYVIRAFNEDVPYNRLVKEHIAGDLLPHPRLSADGAFLESPIATGFYWFGEVLNSATDSAKSRADTVDNQIDVLTKAFLGLTVACARCHDHKFDPIPTTDYYALAGILHSTAMRETVIDSPQHAAAIHKSCGVSANSVPVSLRLRDGDVLLHDFSRSGNAGWIVSGEAYTARGNALVGSLTSSRFVVPKLWMHVRLAGTKPATTDGLPPLRVTLVADDHKSANIVPDGKPGFRWRTARMTKEIGRSSYIEIVDRSRDGSLFVDQIVFSDHPDPPPVDGESTPPSGDCSTDVPESAFAMIAADEHPHDVPVHIRGNHKNLGAEVPRRFLQIIAGENQTPVAQGSGRVMLAEWIASERNPLTARVMVNRIWKHHFGQGLVASIDNFGKTGDRPTDPALLDYLARQFVAGGWSIKALHRMILLSSAFRSAAPPRRLEAEAIRDEILAISGSLDRTMYGPSVMPHISKYQDGRGKPKSGPLDGDGRRSIYIQVRRNFITPMFLAFDYPLPISTIGARGTSTVPSQALLMMNNEFVAQQAKKWAERMSAEEPDPGRRIDKMYETAFARLPENWEKEELLRFAAAHDWADVCHVLFNSAEFIYVR